MLWILILLATLPSIILFGPILILILTNRRFDINTGAICDLNNFRSSRGRFILFFSITLITQVLFLLFRFYPQFSPTEHFVMIIILILGIAALFISSHTVSHLLLILASYTFLVLLMFRISFSQLGALIMIVLACTLGARLGISLVFKRKCHFWLFEYLILALFGLWNIAVLFG